MLFLVVCKIWKSILNLHDLGKQIDIFYYSHFVLFILCYDLRFFPSKSYWDIHQFSFSLNSTQSTLIIISFSIFSILISTNEFFVTNQCKNSSYIREYARIKRTFMPKYYVFSSPSFSAFDVSFSFFSIYSERNSVYVLYSHTPSSYFRSKWEVTKFDENNARGDSHSWLQLAWINSFGEAKSRHCGTP